MESYFTRMSDEPLCIEQHESILKARVLVVDLGSDRNTYRSHALLGMLSPTEHAGQWVIDNPRKVKRSTRRKRSPVDPPPGHPRTTAGPRSARSHQSHVGTIAMAGLTLDGDIQQAAVCSAALPMPSISWLTCSNWSRSFSCKVAAKLKPPRISDRELVRSRRFWK